MVPVPEQCPHVAVRAQPADGVEHDHLVVLPDPVRNGAHPVHERAVLMHILDPRPWKATATEIGPGSDRQIVPGGHEVPGAVLGSAIPGADRPDPARDGDERGNEHTVEPPEPAVVGTRLDRTDHELEVALAEPDLDLFDPIAPRKTVRLGSG